MSEIIEFLKELVADLMTFDDIANVYLNGLPLYIQNMITACLVVSVIVGSFVLLIKIK